MQLDKLTLHNYKIHKSLKLDLGPGVTGIVGDNGSGKSSIISAIRFLFTGVVDTDNKMESVTKGASEGWVTGTFTLNEKQGSLERHLNSSKVVLKYDGVTYKRADEVKELWSRLLQIDASIFNNVIVAAQGEIPLLFSGDQTTREKIFQKIFMVPPTEKLRTLIWEHYIKTCPPERFEEDVSIIQSQQMEIATQRNVLLASIEAKSTAILNEGFLKCVLERISFLEKCKVDAVTRPTLVKEVNELTNTVAFLSKSVNEQKERLDMIDIEKMKNTYNQLLAQKKLAAHREGIEAELTLMLARAPTSEELLEQRKILAALEKEELEAKEVLDKANAAFSHLSDQVKQVEELKGCTTCPTCKQPIHDIVAGIKTLEETSKEAQRDVISANATYMVCVKKTTRQKNANSLLEGQYQRVLNLQEQLSRYGDVTYSKQDLDTLAQVLKAIEQDQKTLQRDETELVRAQGNLAVAEEKLKNLAAYDGKESIEAELAMMNEVLAENKRRIEELDEIRVQQGKLEHELQLLEERINVSLENHKYNSKRRAYLDKLDRAYVLLKPSEFPRKLIQSYSEQVEVFLANYLERFNIPYRAKIEDGFKIEMIDTEDNKMPSVSGGQEMIVGICLRLALHKIFAQSFPLLIIDEGTTHLSASNRKAYFELIEDLRANKTVNQVLIIDHDSQLANVVDKTIEL